MKKRVLCVCNGGNCRSPVLAEAFKGTLGCDAIAIGTYWADSETMKMLCDWADIICPVEPHEATLPPLDLGFWKNSILWSYVNKIKIAEVGPDIWGHHKYDELKVVCLEAARKVLG